MVDARYSYTTMYGLVEGGGYSARRLLWSHIGHAKEHGVRVYPVLSVQGMKSQFSLEGRSTASAGNTL